MKKIVLFLFLIFPGIALAQTDEEVSYPSQDTEITRHCSSIEIEGEFYMDVIITLKSNSYNLFETDNHKVKVLVKNAQGEKLYKKTFKNANLYIFSSGEIHVGKPNFLRILIIKHNDKWIGIIKEKEGIW